jgi:hypothetical protein
MCTLDVIILSDLSASEGNQTDFKAAYLQMIQNIQEHPL